MACSTIVGASAATISTSATAPSTVSQQAKTSATGNEIKTYSIDNLPDNIGTGSHPDGENVKGVYKATISEDGTLSDFTYVEDYNEIPGASEVIASPDSNLPEITAE